MSYVEIDELLTSGAHFGHLTRRWNPYMRPYIFMERNGIHIIDLKKTQVLLDEARDAAERIAAEGKRSFVEPRAGAPTSSRREAARVGLNSCRARSVRMSPTLHDPGVDQASAGRSRRWSTTAPGERRKKEA